MISSVVVLPAPLGPSNPKISPSYTSKLTPFTAVSVSYCLTKSLTEMMGFFEGAIRRVVLPLKLVEEVNINISCIAKYHCENGKTDSYFSRSYSHYKEYKYL